MSGLYNVLITKASGEQAEHIFFFESETQASAEFEPDLEDGDLLTVEYLA